MGLFIADNMIQVPSEYYVIIIYFNILRYLIISDHFEYFL